MTNRVKLDQVLYEIRVYGQYLRVHAIDPNTGFEAIATGQASLGEAALKNNAKMKLEYLLTKKAQRSSKESLNPHFLIFPFQDILLYACKIHKKNTPFLEFIFFIFKKSPLHCLTAVQKAFFLTRIHAQLRSNDNRNGA